MSPEESHVQTARQYLQALESRASFSEIARFFTDDCVQEEFPNRFTPQGARRTLKDLQAAAERGSNAVKSERYEVLSVVAQGDTVALEVAWSAELLVAVGSLQPGDTLRARFAVFLTFRDGRIASQRNYDCFDPF